MTPQGPPPTPEQLDTIARAMLAALGTTRDPPPDTWESILEWERDEFRAMAQAARPIIAADVRRAALEEALGMCDHAVDVDMVAFRIETALAGNPVQEAKP